MTFNNQTLKSKKKTHSINKLIAITVQNHKKENMYNTKIN